jgi:IclR family mhp operon transcriptional activator
MERGAPLRSISRGLAVLQAINASGALSMMDIARLVQLPYPTTARIVVTLVQEGMIEREVGRKTYRTTAKVCSLSNGYANYSRFSAVCRPHLVAMTKELGWATVLSTRVGETMVVRECTHSISPFTLAPYYPGFAYPLWPSAAGRAYVAFLTPAERALARQGPPGRPVDFGGPGVESLSTEEALAEVRAKGYAVGRRNTFTTPPGKNSAIAAPVFVDGRVQAVASLIFLASALKMEQAEALYAGALMKMAGVLGDALASHEAA